MPAASASRLARTAPPSGATSASGVASASRLARVLRTGRDLSERDRRDLSERCRRDLNEREVSREGAGRWGGRAQGCPTRRSPVWRPAQTDPCQGRHTGTPPDPARHRRDEWGETGADGRAASINRPAAYRQIGSHLTTTAARATGHGSPHLQLVGSGDRRLRRRLRDSPGRLRRRARPQRAGWRRFRDSPGRLRRRARPQRTRQARPQRAGSRDLSDQTRHPRAMSKALQSMPDGANDRTDASRP